MKKTLVVTASNTVMPRLSHKYAGTHIARNCTRCKMSELCDHRSRGLNGIRSDRHRRLVVFTDYPDYFADHAHAPYKLDSRKMLDWLFERMSVDPNQVAYEYTLRCYPGRELPSTKAARAACIEECAEYRFHALARIRPKAIAILGQVSLEAFTGRTKIGDNNDRALPCWEPIVRDYCDHVWASYSLQSILGPHPPSDTPKVFRVLYRAAEEAGLNPELNPTVPPFKWRNLK